MSDTPEILLAHHLKALKPATFLRKHQKLARQCAAEGLDHVRYLARLVELELINRERRMVARRSQSHQGREVPGRQKLGQLRLRGYSEAEQDAGAGTGPV